MAKHLHVLRLDFLKKSPELAHRQDFFTNCRVDASGKHELFPCLLYPLKPQDKAKGESNYEKHNRQPLA